MSLGLMMELGHLGIGSRRSDGMVLARHVGVAQLSIDGQLSRGESADALVACRRMRSLSFCGLVKVRVGTAEEMTQHPNLPILRVGDQRKLDLFAERESVIEFLMRDRTTDWNSLEKRRWFINLEYNCL